MALELEDLDWQSGEITVPGKGGSRERLPLPCDVGEALAQYLRRGRPLCSSRRVFVRLRAPLRGFAGSQAIWSIVSEAVGRAGLDPPCRGAHLLRHSLATNMLRQGASLAEIGDVLRHRRDASTPVVTVSVDARRRNVKRRWTKAAPRHLSSRVGG